MAMRRLDRLEGLDDRMLAALAVIDDGFDADALAALAGADDADGALRSAEAAGVLERSRGGYRFRHAFVRDALATRMGEEALQRAHADAAALLATDGSPPETVARHLLHAGHPHEAVPLLTQAAEWAAGVGAYRDGAEWAELALEHADEDERPDLLALRAQLLHGAGEAHAPAAYADAIAAAPSDRIAALRVQQAGACLAAGDIAGATAALDGIDPTETDSFKEAVRLRGMVAWHLGDWEGARRLAVEAGGLPAETLADPAELTDLKAMLAHVQGDWAQHSRRQLTHVWDSPALAGRVFDAYLCITEYVLTSGDPYERIAAFAKRLRAQLKQALELAHVSPLAQHLLFLVYGVLLRVPEDDAEALALIDQAEALFDPRWVCPFCPTGYHVAAASVCAGAGQLERARDFLQRAEQGAGCWPAGPWPAAVAEVRAELLQAEGDDRAAADALRRAAEGYAAAGLVLSERRARERLLA